MPADAEERKVLQQEDPWVLRVKGLDEKLTPHQLGRALFHLQQRRGFKSNRKTDKAADDERGKIKTAAIALQRKMAETGARTLGEYLARPRVKDGAPDHKAAATNPVRARLVGTGAKAAYDFYPTRELVEDEFHCLWTSQKMFHDGLLTDIARDDLCDILFFQRKLKPQPVGKCSLNPRAPRALPPRNGSESTRRSITSAYGYRGKPRAEPVKSAIPSSIRPSRFESSRSSRHARP